MNTVLKVWLLLTKGAVAVLPDFLGLFTSLNLSLSSCNHKRRILVISFELITQLTTQHPSITANRLQDNSTRQSAHTASRRPQTRHALHLRLCTQA